MSSSVINQVLLVPFLPPLQSPVGAAGDTCKPQEYLAGRNLGRLSGLSLLHDSLGHSWQLRLQVHHIYTKNCGLGLVFYITRVMAGGLISLEKVGMTNEGNRLVVYQRDLPCHSSAGLKNGRWG